MGGTVGRRFFRHGELHLVVLVLLSSRALHGYELMAELGRLFGPEYRPSPGSVYPAVKALAAEGLIAPELESEPTRYRTTDSGVAAVADRRDALVALEQRTGVRLGGSDRLEAALEHFIVRVRRLAGRVDPERVAEVLDDAAADIEHLDHAPVEERHDG
jgi:DNA-binding PadR family transcriptional regulator